jgi:hypothetical protein
MLTPKANSERDPEPGHPNLTLKTSSQKATFMSTHYPLFNTGDFTNILQAFLVSPTLIACPAL